MKKAIYREYRPQTFDHVYGQTHITEILKSQIRSDKIGHAYLFSGTRGTGKTSCAKILARAVNCLSPVEGNPCNICENCRLSLEEKTMDIVEMDAASNRRIDDIRQLRESVVYPPANLKYRVYIIDEAHMITNEGFNALLKIMEEPPKHLIFILATTELEKIPPTILSRCQRYEFRRIEVYDIKSNIIKILLDLKIEMTEEGIDLIALKADGSMRDALSSLDQVLSLDKENYDLSDVENVLGVAEQDDLAEIIEYLSTGDYKETLLSFNKAAKGKGAQSTYEELIDYLQNLMMISLNMDQYMGKSSVEEQSLKEIANTWTLDKIMITIDILVHYQSLLKNSEQPHIIIQLALYKACVLEMEESLWDQIASLKRKVEDYGEREISISAPVKKRSEIKVEHVEEKKIEEKNVDLKEVPVESVDDKEDSIKKVEPTTIKEEVEDEVKEKSLRTSDERFNPLWDQFLSEVEQQETGILLKNYLSYVEDKFEYNNQVYIIFPDDQEFLFSRLQIGKNKEDLEKAFNGVFTQSKMRLIKRSEYESLDRKNKKVDHTDILKEIFGDDIEIID